MSTLLSNLHASTDGGTSWSKLADTPKRPRDDCGGIPFIKAASKQFTSDTRLFRITEFYFGDTCGLYRKSSPNPTGAQAAWSGGLSVDHSDTRDLGFDAGGEPLLLATDGGLHKTSDGGASWTTVGGASGYDALQIFDVKAQWVSDQNCSDVYFGTQDNSSWMF